MTAPTLHSPDDTFPPLPNHTHNPKGYIDAIATRRRAALSNPLRPGTMFAVRLTIPTPGPMSDSANANLRTVPLPAPPCHPEPADYILTLQNPVVGANGVSKYGQLWACSVSLASTADGDGGSVWYQTDRVIAKIVQPSMVYLPHISCWPSEFRSPEILAMKEDIAYKQLAPLQGSTIPYYFGMHQVRTPCQEEAWMLVMEKIEGPTVHEWHEFLPHRLEDDESSLSQAAHATRLEELKNLVLSAQRGLQKIHNLNVLHRDTSLKNLIIHTPHGTASDFPRHIVFVDFGMAMIEEFGGRDGERQSLTVHMSDCCGPHRGAVCTWAWTPEEGRPPMWSMKEVQSSSDEE